MDKTVQNLTSLTSRIYAKMTPATVIFVFICVVIIILMYVYYNTQRDDYEKYIGGYWSADNTFCKESDVSSMSLFVGEPLVCRKIDDSSISDIIEKHDLKFKYVRKCYLLIEPDISSQIIYLFYNPVSTYFASANKPYNLTARVVMTRDNLWPDDVNISFNMLDGCMKIYVEADTDDANDGNTDSEPKLYARMYRDGNISEHFK